MISLRAPSFRPARVFRAVARVALVWGALAAWCGAEGAEACQTRDPVPGWVPSAEIERDIRTQLAHRWGVPQEGLVLEWGEPRGGALPDHLTEVQLLGTGRDGRWVASFAPAGSDRDARSVLLRAGVVVPRPVARRPLERGTVIDEGDMEMEARIIWGPPPAQSPVCEAGWVAERRIERGELLSAPAVQPPLLVVSGRPVTVLWSNGRVNVSIQGRAAGSGSLGERVFVRTGSGTRLGGTVEGPGLVRIDGHPTEIGR